MTKYLEEKKNDLIVRAESIVDEAKKEERELTAEETKELADIQENVRSLVEQIHLMDNVDGMEKSKKEDTPNEERDFDEYLRSVGNSRANLDVGSNGAVIPKTIADRIIKKVYDICPILEKSTKYNVTGKVAVPYYDETPQAMVEVAYRDEFVELTSNVGSFKSIELSGYLAGCLSLVSRSLLNNSNFDLVGFVVEHMAYAIKRFVEKEMLNGTPDKVEGLSTLTNQVTAQAQNAITADEVIRLHDAIKDEYQNDAMWVMSPQTRTALRLLKDGEERYLLQDDVSSPFGINLLGKPVYVSDNMPEIAAGNNVIFYGDFSGLASKFGEELNVQVLQEKYATMHAVGVVGWLEFDAKVENAQKLAKLKMAGA